MAAVWEEGNDLPARCISLLQEVKDLIEADSSGPENTDETAAFTSSERQAHCHLPRNNGMEITPPSRELCRILDHSLLLIQPPVPLLPLEDLQRLINLGPFRSKRPERPERPERSEIDRSVIQVASILFQIGAICSVLNFWDQRPCRCMETCMLHRRVICQPYIFELIRCR